jgi:DNA adenine methylase
MAARWTTDELSVLHEYYVTSFVECNRLLKRRSRAAIYTKAAQLGLSRRTRKVSFRGPPAPPKPFVKWAGGKRKLIKNINEVIPDTYVDYYEPFIGGGAVLFHLDPQGNIYIGDQNRHLVEAYQYLKTKSVKTLIKSLQKHQNTKEYFLSVRNQDPSMLTLTERVSRFIYLNKTCFNGLWRENKKGIFNVPFGKYPNPLIVDEPTLTTVSKWLRSKKITVLHGDYLDTLQTAKSDDFVYLDPPYDKENETSFTKYHKTDFSREDQIRLYEEVKRLTNLGVKVLISNANTSFIRDLYKDFEQVTINTYRSINSDGKGRKSKPIDLLIKNF